MESTVLKTRVPTNQKHTTDSQNPKIKEHRHHTKENHQTTKGKTSNPKIHTAPKDTELQSNSKEKKSKAFQETLQFVSK